MAMPIAAALPVFAITRYQSSAMRYPSRSVALVLIGLLAVFARISLADALVGTDPSGSVHIVAKGETLLSIARRYDLGFVELRAANPGIDAWQPGAGTRLVLPTAHLLPNARRKGIVINLAEQRLYYFRRAGENVLSYPVGIGDSGWETPVGATRVRGKRTNPTWIPPTSIRAQHPDLPAAIPPGPANPLGAFALDLAWPGYVIHGTNKPAGIGRRVSHGCIRLYPEDIAQLYSMVPIGTPVAIVDQPVKLGWIGGALYLEVHPTQAQANEIEATGRIPPEGPIDLVPHLASLPDLDSANIDWRLAQRVAAERRGVPVRISR